MKIIIDTTSSEFNRGSFCYLPYILYNAFSEKTKVLFFENFSAADIDKLPKNISTAFISCWSYPQIEHCKVLKRFLNCEVKFFGYAPLIKEFLFSEPYIPTDEIIKKGIEKYPKNYNKFKYILLSDCDMHLKRYEGVVYPLFTSFGCSNACSFCPVSVNCERKRISIYPQKVKEMLKRCKDEGIRNIHFTDEDFFYDIDRAYKILSFSAKIGGFNFIALGSATKVNSFIDKYGQNIFFDSGIKLVEIGLETAGAELSKKMNKSWSFPSCEKVAEKIKIPVLWLTLSFFPGETVVSISKTGEFLHRYGLNISDVYGRIATNGTRGGLGQFFQPYPGTKLYSQINKMGVCIDERPIRLLPSFLPYSLLNDTYKVKRDVLKDDYFWFSLHGIAKEKAEYIVRTRLQGGLFAKQENGRWDIDEILIKSICARLGVIE